MPEQVTRNTPNGPKTFWFRTPDDDLRAIAAATTAFKNGDLQEAARQAAIAMFLSRRNAGFDLKPIEPTHTFKRLASTTTTMRTVGDVSLIAARTERESEYEPDSRTVYTVAFCNTRDVFSFILVFQE